MKSVRIVIFAKAPQPGFAKTRLIPALSVQGAADLARRMFVHTLETAIAADVGSVELCVTPSVKDAVWQTLAIPDTVRWSDQGKGDLGERMARAAQGTIDSGESVVLIGTDCPELSVYHIRHAASVLQHSDSVLFPTFDGGYALLGLNGFSQLLFTDIAWSTNTVAFETLFRLKQLGWTVRTHRMLHDIDEPADLRWLPTTWLMKAKQ
ncbi:TIGR04282 family arsenosugar biosynthesis glycosyltransferase [Undibacterium sp. FT31W]|uniref:TIGR04282 family arsenosugar biosynthesis glycosyltransferase n=2 Tax=Undibacterium griseum TaxID=2762295 RepID=A0ABR6YJI5_9BURK|nr:TIGR04282 family arsenosugar biosynthesis glycosyltransferase [Undibacterium griseum]